ncbi:ORF6N domain-containing protein [Clostridium baratii]
MNNLVKINNNDLQAKEFKGQRVITFKEIDLVHERVEGTANKRFLDNQKHFIEGVDYFEVTGDVLKEIKRLPNFGIGLNASKAILITESGYLMLVKSLSDDLAWTVQRELVNKYFRVKELKVGQPQLIIPELKQKEIETKNNNSFARVVNSIDKALKNPNITKETKDNLNNKLNQFLGEKPKDVTHLGKKTYSATEIGKKLGVSSQKIGRLTEKHKLKTDKFGEWFKDKSKYSSKEVPSFRYYENIIPVLKGLLDGKQEKLEV